MSIKAWLATFGAIGLWYIIQHGEFTVKWSETRNNAELWGDAWIASSSGTLSDTSGVVRALVDTSTIFNDFMDDLAENDSDLLSEWMTTNPSTGLKELPDTCITLPNGLVWKIIDGGEVSEFKLDLSASAWRGFYTPLMGIDGISFCLLCFRLKSTPTVDTSWPGSEDWNYVDYDGVVRVGTACTPPRSLRTADLEYITSCFLLFLFICDFLRASGLNKTLMKWWNKSIMRREFRKVRSELENIQEQVDILQDITSELNIALSEVSTDYFGALSSLAPSKTEKVYLLLKKMGYRPWG